MKKNKQEPQEIAYSLPESKAKFLYSLAKEAYVQKVGFDKDREKMALAASEVARNAAMNILYVLHEIDGRFKSPLDPEFRR